MAEIDLAESSQNRLKSGIPPWSRAGTKPTYQPLQDNLKVDAMVIGGGITGALMGQHLSERGLSVVIVDRETPGLGSTVASTAMLQWEIDRTLGELEHFYGFERAVGIYRRSAASVAGLSKLIVANRIACNLLPRQSLFLTSNQEGAGDLLREVELRRRAGLPSRYLEHCDLFTEFELDRDAGILSRGSAEADPLLLTWALLDIAVKQGVRLIGASVTKLHSEGGRVSAETDGSFVIEAETAVLATGYAMPGIDMPKLHRTTSSWALATMPQDPAMLWRDQVLIWEDSHPYLYMRTTPDGRIIAGGEDDDTVDPAIRDAKLAEKIMTIREKMKRLWSRADTRVATAWCGTFGETADGLPLIGPVPLMPQVYAAYGYGGNGITFSYLATQVIGAMIGGGYRDWFDDFALDRDAPAFVERPSISEDRRETALN
ncbi:MULTISPECIES: FAD-dependent oxidoreductase [unclassified Rhizobium]|uniref:NAD(P)/FAD-dependent oxidoreductase n=1 Tax=unclassified Rhizobium TaxID=2613769 RepID=UPI001047E93B|nr:MULTISPECIES: FAD-dependent oxidoreductase [unclassified Rhizobium]MBB3397164.1 glycine/D-amino acid oxidase-like deaminating enzyme [Rhizobium sp. BK060]MBB4168718.1 glycine/D-amino acid oxidase-like deaminating enzyme [Rhizobium sp. BK538]TCM73300.1 glycine/D-amino acid oxidase-like deaminating enzyme [Rhizobium sp. BK068]